MKLKFRVRIADLKPEMQAEITELIREYLVEFRHKDIEDWMAEHDDANPDNPQRASVTFENAVAVLTDEIAKDYIFEG